MLKLEVCWGIVRFFNYDDNLELKYNFDQYKLIID